MNILYNTFLKTTEPKIIFSTLRALTRFTVPKKDFFIKSIKLNDNFDYDLNEMGYLLKQEVYSTGEYSKRGFIRDIYLPNYKFPVRIELFDDTIDRMTFFDPNTQKSIKTIEEFDLISGHEIKFNKNNFDIFEKRFEKLKKEIENVTLEVEHFQSLPAFFYQDKESLLTYIKNNYQIYIVNKKEVIETFAEKERECLEMCDSKLKKYIYKAYSGLPVEIIKNLKYEEIEFNFKKNIELRKIKNSEEEINLDYLPLIDWDDLKENDYVVHEEYGIGIFKGIKKTQTALGLREYLTIEYSDSSKVLVPAERLEKISKYIGEEKNIKISSLSNHRWKNTKKKVQEEIRQKIQELVKMYALRETQKGIIIEGDYELEKEFKSTFPYIETSDQLKSIKEIFEDLKSEKPMDRLLVGDAGFGKTEVAMRAAFKTAVSGYQSVVLAPTTILANQHYKTFKERFESFGIKTELITRMKTPKEKEKLIKDLKEGKLDILIGTHALLNEKITFYNLGLVVVDEEQRFGVMQKEKFMKLNEGVNFLMMSATPIPRTLYMSLSGLREISKISTPPFGRLPIQTYIGNYTEKLTRTAILREKSRGGQVLYVHNRVNDIKKVYEDLKKLVPEVKIDFAHGTMNKIGFKKTIESFYKGELDVLIATTIVENGIDIPNANTLIVDDSQRYGISQLYQLKGRVGRASKRAFAYFLLKNETPNKDTMERLHAIKKYNEPGSGLKLAIRDMEIRGYGDLLGFDQKGKINSVGLNMYKNILNNELLLMNQNETEEKTNNQKIYTEIKGIKGSIIIPETYIENSFERMRFYRRISVLNNLEELKELEKELKDRFGNIPLETINLLRYAKIRLKSSEKGIEIIEIGEKYLKLTFSENQKIEIKKFEKISKKTVYHSKTNEVIIYGTFDEINLLEKII